VRKAAVIFVAGGETLIGAAILRVLRQQGCERVLGGPDGPLDLCSAAAVDAFFARHRPEYVFHAGGRSGGIAANTKRPAELAYDNLLGSAHVVHAAHTYGARRLLYLASSCSYPRLCPQPMQEENLLSGPLEPTNEAYAVAKLAGMKLCQAYRQQYGDEFLVGIPANAFGPGDPDLIVKKGGSPEDSHVIAALLRRFHEAKLRGDAAVSIWGSGRPRREFIYVDDLADACLFVMERYRDAAPLNLGGGTDLSIRALAEKIREIVGYSGGLEFDASRPDGMPLKALDSSKLLGLGWRPKFAFDDALRRTYEAFLRQTG
jgi:GDP-L-fucose synthase